MKTSLSDREIVERAADAMERYGWVAGARCSRYGEFGGNYGPMCVLGALEFGAGGDPNQCRIDHHPVVGRLASALNDMGALHSRPEDSYSAVVHLAAWSNAADGLTVVKALREAAKEL